MKKILITIILTLIAASAFAQTYTVQEVTGRVERNTGKTKWAAITKGETLAPETVIRTQIGANLVVKNGGDELLTIGPMKNGALSALLKENEENTIRQSTPTARKKASDAAADIEIAE